MHLLSVAMIVKDEAFLLPECLEQATQWADEICVVDTGSADETPAILAAHGCRTALHPWSDDFSAARNAAIDLCTGRWIFVLDADERLRPEDFSSIRALCEGPADKGIRFITRNYSNRSNLADFVPTPGAAEARGHAGWFPSGKVRLFPNQPGFRFEGLVHEMVNPAIERAGLPIVDTAIPVLHYPLLKPAASLASKQDLYLRLGEAKCAAQPGDAKAHGELGDQLMDMNQVQRAAAAYREAVRCDPGNPARLKDLGTALYLLGHVQKAAAFLEAAVDRDPALVDGWRNLGVLRAGLGEWSAALPCFEAALRGAPGHPELLRYTALALHQLQRDKEAWPLVCQALIAAPEEDEIQGLWIAIARSDENAARNCLLEQSGVVPDRVSGDLLRRLATPS